MALILLLLPLALPAWPLLAGAPVVVIRTEKRVHSAGTAVRLVVHNRSKAPIYLPGCAQFSLQRYLDAGWVALAPMRCAWEGTALKVPPGTRVLPVPAAEPGFSVLRAQVTFGVGCQEGLPLSSAACAQVETVRSPPFSVFGPETP